MTSIFTANMLQTKATGFLTRLCKISRNHNIMQVVLMKRLAYQETTISKPPPYPYWNRECVGYKMIRDFTSLRYDDNSKLIVVDGPPALGKTEICQKIAEQFGMLYMPAPILDEIYINPYGYDVRQLNSQLPPEVRSFALEQFLADPNNSLTARMQLLYFMIRLEQYQNALLHLLATGQGVVLHGSIFSTIAYAYAMHHAGYLLKDELIGFNQMLTIGLNYLLRPTLVIYLEVSPEIALQKIKQRGKPEEVNSKVFTTKYLSDLNEESKSKYRSLLKQHSEILHYNWTTEGNAEDIISDIEDLNLNVTEGDEKFEDWHFWHSNEVIEIMNMYQRKWPVISRAINNIDPILECRYLVYPESLQEERDILNTVPEEKYSYGYNPHYGDKVLFKNDLKPLYLSVIRRTPRDFINFDQISKISLKRNES